ncbi:hypothetical protein H2204_004952 [Knufia peltigerae]|uniref:AB hydrolase-1 domain-containing protein n=1 Tax=Knufia peltigerae TaxID=1002370 RepID=A0AA39CYX2_9EURO|nr:hypothetical protein H2204_004952 [Knufia peltigerae]
MAGLLAAAILFLIDRHRSSVWASPVAHATTRGPSASSSVCKEFDVAIPASAPGARYDLRTVDTDLDAAAWAIESSAWSAPPGNELVLENITISGTYNIHGRLCAPSVGGGGVLQIASHGAHYDGRYWDADPPGHSYVDAALDAGYSILTYDRLSAGRSDHPDAYTGVQAPLELEILRELTTLARNGTLASVTGVGAAPNKTVHVGHSYGSFLTTAFIATYPELTEGAVITGFVLNRYLGSVGDAPWAVRRAPDRPPGYVLCEKVGIQNLFFAGDFTQAQLDLGDSLKQAVPVAEITSGYELLGATGPFKGPIHYMLAEKDFYICGGDCRGLYSVPQQYKIFPNASDIQIDLQPDTGHALPMHNNATAGFQVSFDFLAKHGL